MNSFLSPFNIISLSLSNKFIPYLFYLICNSVIPSLINSTNISPCYRAGIGLAAWWKKLQREVE